MVDFSEEEVAAVEEEDSAVVAVVVEAGFAAVVEAIVVASLVSAIAAASALVEETTAEVDHLDEERTQATGIVLSLWVERTHNTHTASTAGQEELITIMKLPTKALTQTYFNGGSNSYAGCAASSCFQSSPYG